MEKEVINSKVGMTSCGRPQVEESGLNSVRKTGFTKTQRVIKSILVLAFATIGCVNIARAQDVIGQGSCGANGSQVMWRLTSDSVMTITSRDGDDMENFGYEQAVPWHSHRAKIKTLIFSGGLNRLGKYAFYECVNLESVIIPRTVTRINDYAFEYCSKLKTLTIESEGNDVIIAQRAFGLCHQLSTIICKGIYPPQVNTVYLLHSFEGVPDDIPVIIPCGKEFDYVSSAWGNKFSNIIEDCTIPVTDITLSTTTAMAGTPLTLTATIVPSNATNKDIVWNIVNANGTGANISGNTFTATAEGTASIKATITDGKANGTPFTKEFNISVTAVGIEQLEIENGEWKIYPNPTKGQLIINNEQLSIDNVEIYDVIGQLLYQINKSTNKQINNEISIDISHLASGVYIVRLFSGTREIGYTKIIKE